MKMKEWLRGLFCKINELDFEIEIDANTLLKITY